MRESSWDRAASGLRAGRNEKLREREELPLAEGGLPVLQSCTGIGVRNARGNFLRASKHVVSAALQVPRAVTAGFDIRPRFSAASWTDMPKAAVGRRRRDLADDREMDTLELY